VAFVAERVLIVNADDFGLSRGVNAGVIKAHEEGIVTSASLMVRGSGAREAAEYARRKPSLAVGLHVDLGEWVFVDGHWRERYRLVAADDRDGARAEARAQLELFRGLMGRDPTHVDSHQHVHFGSPAVHALLEIGDELGVPVRHFTESIHYLGDFYGQEGTGGVNHSALTVPNLSRLIRELGPGTTEIGCHPAAAVDFDSVYNEERLIETETLCDPAIREAIEDEKVALQSFGELEEFAALTDVDKVPASMDHKGFTLWLTGLPRAGKSTVAGVVAGRLRSLGIQSIEVLDGDEVREGLCRDLGFSRADRDENIHRITYVSKVLTRNGVVVIVAAISPYREGRERAREEIQSFVEVWCKASVEACAARDYKGLYEKAMRGEIDNLTGVNDPYEEPEDADLVLATDSETPEQSAERVMDLLREKQLIP
jgi:adenylyl-sulfate kinase